MSTRATYKISGMTFYVHHDGYEEGAAHKFLDMLNAEGNGGYREAFIRGNAGAEFTEGHSAHEDTEYRYSLYENDGLWMLKVDVRESYNEGARTYRIPLEEFINEYIPNSCVKTNLAYRERIYTADELKEMLKSESSLKETWIKNGFEGSGNFKSLVERIAKIEEVLNEL